MNYPSKLISLWYTLHLVNYFGMHLCNHVGSLSHSLLTLSSSFKGLKFIHVTPFKYFQLMFLFLITMNSTYLLLRSWFRLCLVHFNLSTMSPIEFVSSCLCIWIHWSWYPYTLLWWFFEWYSISTSSWWQIKSYIFLFLT